MPDGFRDIIASVESGDTIKILMSRTQKSIKQELSSFVKNFRVQINLIEKQGPIEEEKKEEAKK